MLLTGPDETLFVPMTTIKLTGQFLAGQDQTVGHMCWISPDLAGSPLSTDISGHTVYLQFPPRPSDDIAPHGYNGRMGDDPTNPVGVSPTYFVAELDWVLEDAGAESQNLQEAVEVLRAGATRLTDGLRLAQPDSGLAGDAPRVLSLSAVDISTGEDLPLGVPPNKSSPMAVGYPVVDTKMVAHALAGDLDVPEILLAQAAHWTLWTPNPNPGLGVLLVAMACESKARRVLVERVPKEMEPLLTVLLDKPRVFQHPASDLFHHIAQAVLGRSLRVDDDPLWKQVVKVFELRNQMAHRGREPTRSETGPLVAAGYNVFDWLAQ